MGTLMIVLITLLAVSVGTLATWIIRSSLSMWTRLCAGSVVGLALLSWISFLISLLAGLNAVSISLTVGVLIIALFLLARAITPALIRAELRTISFSRSDCVYYILWSALLIWLFSRVVMLPPDGLHTAPANNYGDLPFHFSVITSFAYGENLPPQNPIFAGMKFTYPFLIDFLTAFFMWCGADWRAAFFVENIILALSLVGLIELFTRRLTGNVLAARIAPVIFLFNGGLGFINFFRDWSQSPLGFIDFIAHLPTAYTMSANLQVGAGQVPLRWGNVFTTLLIPQRSMLFGLPFVAMIMGLWWRAVGEREGETETETERQGNKETRGQVDEVPLSLSPSLPPSLFLSPRLLLLAAGILAGLLPMLHAHGFLSIMIASGVMVLLFWSWDWIAFYLPVALLAGPQALWLSGTPVKIKLMEKAWWEAGETNPLLFWGINAGVFLLLLLIALNTYKPLESRVQRFYLPFLLWFIIPNFVLLAPWPWDNIKMLVYWSLASSPLVAAMLAYLFTRKHPILRGLAAVLLITLTFSGALDVWRSLSPAENYPLFGKAELEVAALLREQTPPRAVILHAPIHNSVVALTGRQSVMGYPGHLWTHGINYGTREQDVKTIYQGGDGAAELLNSLRVNYVVIGPPERSQLQVNDGFFASRYPKVIDHGEYHVYQIK